VFANYSSANGHTFIDHHLYLPEEWTSDSDRQEEASISAGLIFRAKPKLALEMVAGTVLEQIPFRWIGGDSVYDNSPTFVQGVRQLGKW
jgi:SRSO17 transposase